MPKFSPGSFTKNFSWNESYLRLHTSIRNGFSESQEPVTRANWRLASGIHDKDRQLVPMNFFLFNIRGVSEDFLLVDQLVDAAQDPYNEQFARLALFSFHLANSGSWHGSQWPDGKVAGWANELILTEAWTGSDWNPTTFTESALLKFIEKRIDAEPVTLRKIFTNYRYMLRSAGVLVNDRLRSADLRQRWLVDAVQLFWDREIFSGSLPPDARLQRLEEALIEKQVYKLLRCTEDQSRIFARAAYPEFSDGQGANRIMQVESLRRAGAVAA